MRFASSSLAGFFAACFWVSSAGAWSDPTQYFVPMPTAPQDGNEALNTLWDRAQIYLGYYACGEENQFLSLALDRYAGDDGLGYYGDTGQAVGDLLDRITAKLYWLKTRSTLGNSGQACDGNTNFNVPFAPGNTTGSIDDFYGAGCSKTPNSCHDSFTAKLADLFNPSRSEPGPCSHPPSGSDDVKVAHPEGIGFATVQVFRSVECMKEQINFILLNLHKGGANPGTEGLPCYEDPLHTTKGNWDMQMLGLMRIVMLDTRTGETSILTADALKHITEDLLAVDGPPGPEAYPWWGCGDNENSTGSPQDREDQHQSDNSCDFLCSIWDAFKWFFSRVIQIAQTSVNVVQDFFDLFGVHLPRPLNPYEVLNDVTIPESENHRLAIESTRFLNNQLIITARGGPGQAAATAEDQALVRNWLLNRFQQIAMHDFIEYNARPYHGISIAALQNLADFSNDFDVATGARMLIEYSAAKFAVGSNQGRRIVPFRRHFAAVDCIDANPCPNLDPSFANNYKYAEIFNDFYQMGDSEVATGLLFTGQTQQLPFGRLSGGALSNAMAAATSTSNSIPDRIILDLTIRKDYQYLQRIHHAAWEVYSSSSAALITAGGMEADHAYCASTPLGCYPTPGNPDDLGAGVPTTVMLTGKTDGPQSSPYTRTMLGDFVSFRGVRDTSHSGEETFTNNLCVWRNFACGMDIQVPFDLQNCLRQYDPAFRWYFVDTKSCVGYQDLQRVVLVFYVICPGDICTPPFIQAGSAGFVEVVENPDKIGPLASIESQVITNNPPGAIANLGQGCLTGGPCSGRYHTVSSHDLDINLRGPGDPYPIGQHFNSGISAVDGVAQQPPELWKFADGDAIKSNGGIITISNCRWGTQLLLDFSDVNRPRRWGPSSQPCQ